MDNDDVEGNLGIASALDPKLMIAATTLLIAASVGTWKVLQPALPAGFLHRSLRAEQSSQAVAVDADASGGVDKKKRAKDRRKRAPVPKLPKAALALGQPSSPANNKKVIRQPSALMARRPRAQSPSSSTHDESLIDDTPRPLSVNTRDSETNNDIAFTTTSLHSINAENIPLPPSPVPARSHSPPPQPSPSASTSASTSGTPVTPPSIAVSQLSLPALATDTPNWQWDDKHTHDASPVPQRGRKRPPRRNKSPTPSPLVATFPTLNTLPPPNTPLDVQVEFMRKQVETFRTQDQANRVREEALLMDVERLRIEAEQSRQDVSRLQWQLNDMSQREERLMSQLSSLTIQMQTMHQSRPGQPLPSGPPMPLGIPIPLYQPQPIPYPQPQGHLGFYHHPHAPHPYATGSPMHAPPTPTSLLSPTHLHPLMTAASIPPPHPQSGTPTSPLAIESFRGGSRGSMRINQTHTPDGSNDYQDNEISFGLMEAIFKRPESYSASRGSGSVRSTRSPSESLSPTGSSTGLRSVHASRSPSVSGQDADGIPVPVPSISSLVMGFEPKDAEVLSEEPEEEETAAEALDEAIQETNDEDQRTPGQDIPVSLQDHPLETVPDEPDDTPPGNSDVQVYY